ncbi:MAG: RNA polymerase sigma factor, partial [Myxococcaceae bacterium]
NTFTKQHIQIRNRSEAWPDKLLGRLRELKGGVAESHVETRLSLGSELMKLDERSREIALLHFLDGMTQEEIATRTGYSRKTVGVKLKAAEEKLRTALDTSIRDGAETCPSP